MMLTRSWCRRTSWSLPKTFFEPWPKHTRICITAFTIPQDINVKLTTSCSHKLHLHRWLERSFRPWYVWTSPSSRANWAGQNLSPPTYSSWSVTRILFFQRKWLHDHPNPVIQPTQTYAKTRLLSVAPSRVTGKYNKAKTHNLVQNNVEDSRDQGKRAWVQALTSLGTAFSGAENLPASRRRQGKSFRRGSWNRCAKLALNINAEIGPLDLQRSALLSTEMRPRQITLCLLQFSC